MLTRPPRLSIVDEKEEEVAEGGDEQPWVDGGSGEDPEDLQAALAEAEAIRRARGTQPAATSATESDAPPRLSPAEMRSRLLTELRRQEDLFNYAAELADLEKAYTVQSARDVVAAVMRRAEDSVALQQQQAEAMMQQQAY